MVLLKTFIFLQRLFVPKQRKCVGVLRSSGCLTIVKRVEPILDSEGNVQEWKNRGMYFFVHSKDLRNAYDTYKVIENLRKSGFKENSQEISNNTTIVLNSKKGK